MNPQSMIIAYEDSSIPASEKKPLFPLLLPRIHSYFFFTPTRIFPPFLTLIILITSLFPTPSSSHHASLFFTRASSPLPLSFLFPSFHAHTLRLLPKEFHEETDEEWDHTEEEELCGI